MKIANKVIVVTGAGSGIGRALTLHLVRKGARVAMVDLDEPGLQETAATAGVTQVSIHKLNVADREGVDKLPAAVIKAFGVVDGVINNAGIIHPFTTVNDLDYDRIEHVMNVNFYGTLYMTKAFLPHLLKRPEAHIANVSSMGGFIPFPGQTIYGASKAAVKLLTEGLFAELQNTRVRVTGIFPGAVNTNIMSNSGVQSATGGAESSKAQSYVALPAEKAASIIVKAIEENRFRVMVGSDARTLDTLYRLAPARAVKFIVKKMAGIR